MIDFGKCSECGGRLIPIWNTWISENKKIHGIDVLRCKDCCQDYPAPSDYDEVVELC